MSFWIGGDLYSIDSQHLLPRRLTAGDFQGVVGVTGLEIFQLFLILLVDLGNGGADGLACAGVLPGKENTEAGANQQPNQADHHNY